MERGGRGLRIQFKLQNLHFDLPSSAETLNAKTAKTT